MSAILLRPFASLLALLLVTGSAATVSAQQPSKKGDEPETEQIPAKLSLTLDPGGHWGHMHGVFFLPDGKHVVTLGEPSSVRLWEVETGRSVKVVYLPGVPLRKGGKAEMTSDGTRLAVPCAYFEGTTRRIAIYFLKMPECRLDRVFPCEGEINAFALAPDGKRMAMTDKSGNRTRLWNLEKEEPPTIVTKIGTQRLTFSPDGTRLACSVDFGSSVIFDLKDENKKVMTLRGGQAVWSPDGQSVATIAPNTPGEDLKVWNTDGTLRYAKFKGNPNSVAFSGDSKSLVVTWSDASRPRVLETATGNELAQKYDGQHSAYVAGALSHDGALVAAAHNKLGQVQVWNTKDGTLKCFLGERQPWLTRPGCEALWKKEGEAIAWHLEAKKKKAKLVDPPSSFDLHELSMMPALAREDAAGGQVRTEGLRELIVAPTKVEIRKKDESPIVLTGKKSQFINGATFIGKDWVAVTSTYGGPWQLIDLTGKNSRAQQGHLSAIKSLSPSPDGKYLMTLSQDQTLRVWNPGQESWLLSMYVKDRDWVIWTPDGYYAASPGGERLAGWLVNHGPDKLKSFHPVERFRKQFYRPDVISRLLEFGSVEKALQAADKERGFKSTRSTVEESLPPIVTVLEPAAPKDGKTTVQAKAMPQGKFPITELQLLVDGRPHSQGLFPVKEAKVGPVETSWTIELPPGNEAHKVNVVARTSVSSGISSTLDIASGGANAMLPSLHILSIGINSYGGDWKLNCASNDAKGIKEVFEQRSAAIYRGVNENAKLLTDTDATKANILADLDALRKRVKPQDVAVIFFAGHGVKGKKGAFYLCPHGTDFADVEKTGISNDEIKKTLAKMQGRILVMLDACHSGASRLDEFARELTDDDCGVIVMCAAMGRETAGEEKKLGHGYFAKAVIDGLGGKADISRKDGQIYLHHLESFVIEEVQTRSNDEQHPVMSKPMSVRSFALAKPGK